MNGSLEAWSSGAPLGWTESASSAVQSALAEDGCSAAQVTAAITYGRLAQQIYFSPAQPAGTTLAASAWFKYLAGSGTAYLSLGAHLAGNEYVDSICAIGAAWLSEWTEVTCEYLVPAGKTMESVEIHGEGSDITFLMDHASLAIQ